MTSPVEEEAYAISFSWPRFSMLAEVSISTIDCKIGQKREMPNAELVELMFYSHLLSWVVRPFSSPLSYSS
jgi:hypothetical protein